MPKFISYRHKKKPYTIDLEQVLLGIALRQNCTITFKNGVSLDYPYPLAHLEKLLAGMGCGRVNFSTLVLFSAIIDYSCPNAILKNGKKLPDIR